MITFLRLQNFKCFEELELNLAPLTLLTGINGMGKSSVIQSLLILRQSNDSRYLFPEKKILLKGELTNLVSGEELRYSLAKTFQVSLSIEYDDNTKGRWEIKASGLKSLLDCEFKEDPDIQQKSLFDNEFLYLGAERLGPRPNYIKQIMIKHEGRFGSGRAELMASYLYSCLSENKSLPILALKHENASDDLIYGNTSHWLSDIVYEGTEIAANELTQDRVELHYSFKKGKFTGATFSPLNVAFGFTYTLPIILGILSAKPGSLMLIENPEAHLHPSAQSKIGKLISLAAQNGVQVILETHSDHLLNGIRVAIKDKKINTDKVLIHYFNSELREEIDKRTHVTIKISEEGKLDDWPKDFFDEWDNNLMKLL